MLQKNSWVYGRTVGKSTAAQSRRRLSKTFMKIVSVINNGIFTICIFLLSCHHKSNKHNLTFSKLMAFNSTYTEGDDGLHTYILTVTDSNGVFSAQEISTDNYSIPKTFDTLNLQRLDEDQILKTTHFLNAVSKIHSDCDQVASVIQKLSISYNGKEIEIEGNCDWGEADYFTLRTILFYTK